MTTLNDTIPDENFLSTAFAVATELGYNENATENVLLSYVDLAVNKKISDYGTSNYQQQNIIVQQVASDSGVDVVTVQNVLNTLTVLSSSSNLIDIRIVYPSKFESILEAAQTQENTDTSNKHGNDTLLGGGLNLLGTEVKNGVESFFKGIGFNIPFELVIILAAGVIFLIYFPKLKS